MAPTKQTSRKSFQSTTAEPCRRSTRTPASRCSQPRQRVPIQCTWTNCTASVIHFHPLSKDPQQHFLPRPEYAVDSVELANPERGSPSQQFASAQISTTRTMSQSTTRNKQKKSNGVQKKITTSKRVKARKICKKTRARDRTDAREQRARKQVQKVIEDAETAAGLNHIDRVAATDPSPCNRDGLDVIKQHELISGATSMDDPHTPILQTSEEALTSPPAVSRSPQQKHHGYTGSQGSPLGRRWSRRGREPEVKQSSVDALVEEESNLTDSKEHSSTKCLKSKYLQ